MSHVTKVSYVIVGDKAFASIEDACWFYGIKRKTYNTRVQLGIDPYEAMTKPVRKQGKKC